MVFPGYLIWQVEIGPKGEIQIGPGAGHVHWYGDGHGAGGYEVQVVEVDRTGVRGGLIKNQLATDEAGVGRGHEIGGGTDGIEIPGVELVGDGKVEPQARWCARGDGRGAVEGQNV